MADITAVAPQVIRMAFFHLKMVERTSSKLYELLCSIVMLLITLHLEANNFEEIVASANQIDWIQRTMEIRSFPLTRHFKTVAKVGQSMVVGLPHLLWSGCAPQMDSL